MTTAASRWSWLSSLVRWCSAPFSRWGSSGSTASPGSLTRFEFDRHLADHLRLWKKTTLAAPKNELQSLQAWTGYLAAHGAEKTLETMRLRMVLLMNEAYKLEKQGREAEDEAGIYKDRPRED